MAGAWTPGDALVQDGQDINTRASFPMQDPSNPSSDLGLLERVRWPGKRVLADPRTQGLCLSASARPGFLPPGAGFQLPLLEAHPVRHLPFFLR